MGSLGPFAKLVQAGTASVVQLGCAVPRRSPFLALGLQKQSIPSASKLGEPSLLLLAQLGEVGKFLLPGETIPRKSLLKAGKRARIGLMPWHLLPWPFDMPRTGSDSFAPGRRREMLVQLPVQGNGGERSCGTHGPLEPTSSVGPGRRLRPMPKIKECV